MRLNILITRLIVLMQILFLSCMKKKYSCACTAHIVYWVLPSPAIRYEKYYNTEQIIDQKLTKKKANSSCKMIEKSFSSSIRPIMYVYVESQTSSCVIK